MEGDIKQQHIEYMAHSAHRWPACRDYTKGYVATLFLLGETHKKK